MRLKKKKMRKEAFARNEVNKVRETSFSVLTDSRYN